MIAFKISVMRFLNNFPKMKKSLLFIQFLKNNFKIFRKICQENVSESKEHFLGKYLYLF